MSCTMGPVRYASVALLLVRALTAAHAAVSSANDQTPVIDAENVQSHWDVRIPLRDGVHLSATVYTPRGQKEPAPCIFTLTPYIAQSYHDRGVYFAAHGYPFLTVDVRGRGNSEGQTEPLLQRPTTGTTSWSGSLDSHIATGRLRCG